LEQPRRFKQFENPPKPGQNERKGKSTTTGPTGSEVRECVRARARARAIPLLSIAYCAKTETGNRKKQGLFHTVAFCDLHKKRIMETQILHHAKNTFFKKSSKKKPKSFKML
jgi:hypothetical protein